MTSSSSPAVTVRFQPLGQRGQVPAGISLLEAARRLGVGLSGVCGGMGVCATCRVVVPPESRDALSPPSDTEQKRLGPDALARGVRLACRATIRDSLQVFVPPESLTASQRTQIEGRQTLVRPEPVVAAVDLHLPPPTLSDPRSDAERLREVLGRPVRLDLEVLRQSPLRLREWEWATRAVLRGDEVVALLPPGTPLMGVAIDLGTTKLAGYLLNLETGETVASAGAMNPQLAYGEDVMARITYALQEPEGAERLRQAAAAGLAQLIRDLCDQAGTASECIVEAVVVGNTAMHHLFLGLSTRSLGLAPYVPVESASLDVRAREVGLPLAPGASIHLLPNIAGFVGADHVAALLATRMDEADHPTLLLDIGTNTEICLAVEGNLFSCSAASGPAFEGAHIRFGMRAAPGAVERVRMIEGKVWWETVEGAPPVGICGSGILDAVAQLREAGLLNERGGWASDNSASPALVSSAEGGPEFILVPAEASGLGRAITLSRKDVGEIQLAKAAIAAGWQVLLEEAGLQESDLARVLVAGAFGTYIDIGHAVAIGMLPRLPLDRFEQVGNVAGTGARMALLSRTERERATHLARRVRYIELTIHPSFRGRFAQAMFL
ncbi:MAG: ASKHA domain-containing protein [Anaerolineae bacterium]|nr:ASKHA domain-containing protein [Anaerolineae bacterium]MDW8068051.1 ASKHA domain-containing protein [Anaerolineae bacterium]